MEKEVIDMENILQKFNNQSITESEDMTLRCGACDNYLSVPPIFNGHEYGSTCGRNSCRKYTAPGSTRNLTFENLARDISFPCMFEQNGCQEKIPWNAVEEHENTCEFSKFFCPLSKAIFKKSHREHCNWKGKTTELMKHFEESHPERKLENYENVDLKDVKESQIFFSKICDAIVIIFIIFTECSDLYCKVWVDLELYGKVRFMIHVQTGENTFSSQLLSAPQLHPPFDDSDFDGSWLHVNNNYLEMLAVYSISLNLEFDLTDSP